MRQIVILFLDFDGVLHPANVPVGADTDFCRVPLLEAWLRQHPTVNVVISSSWRELMTLDQIRQKFNEDIRPRIIDVCPRLLDKYKVKYIRYAEIAAWIALAKYQGPWLALDDAAHLFPPNCKQLIVCQKEEGINHLTLEALNAQMEMLKIHASM